MVGGVWVGLQYKSLVVSKKAGERNKREEEN
jgi:hypothetical protein